MYKVAKKSTIHFSTDKLQKKITVRIRYGENLENEMAFEDMKDLRDRAYLIIYSENKSLGKAMKVKQEEIIKLIEMFIKQTEAIDLTFNNLQTLYDFGYPV